MTFKEIGRVLGVSPQRAEKIYQRALRKLSSPKNLKKWQEILDTIKEIEKEKAKGDSNTLDFKV
ncbi:sigma factor-like helix-turn-helix DNA-binding protein [Helicobacter rodentium]|uniref:sigma factor-like helix-turn-helix DNA-binding protein n=1 Tax=Helicobacter rodentium TaxID=59617 RepID=UPI00047AC993|nr:sigma factor-like helix-turn-helix DNA-binding protein [Helicobacter rodentium]